MKLGKLVVLLFLICIKKIYVVIGQTINNVKSDCTILYNFVNGDSKDYSNLCCHFKENKEHDEQCDNENYIKELNLYSMSKDKISNLPYFSRIEKIEINNKDLKKIPDSILKLTTLKFLSLSDNQIEVIPLSIHTLSQLEHLDLENNNIKEWPSEIFNLKNLKYLNLGNNNIEVIPSTIQNLSKLENLYLYNSNIKFISNELFNLKNLKLLNFQNCNIETIPPEIQNLSQLEELNLSENNIKEMPIEIFNLTNLKTLKLRYNINLNTPIINFGNSTINSCNFSNINVVCYQKHTCESIDYDKKVFSDADAEKYLKICTKEEIDNFKRNRNNIKKSSSSFIIVGSIILGCIFVILIGNFVYFVLINKNKSKNNSDLSINEESQYRAILNANSNDIVHELNTNNNSNNNNNNNNNNLNQNISIFNITVNSNINNYYFLNNSQNSGSYGMTNVPLFNNNNNNNYESLDIHETLPSYEESNRNADNDINEPPPEYTDFNNLIK